MNVDDEPLETERLERALARARRRLVEAQRIARMAYWEWDPATDELSWSDGVQRILGLDDDAEPPSYDELEAYLPSEAYRQRERAIARSFERDTTFDFHHRLIQPDGDVRYVRVLGEPEFEDGQPVRLRGVLHDITEQREVEADLAVRQRQQRAVARLGRAALQRVEPDALMQRAIGQAIDVLGLEYGGIFELDHSRDVLHLRMGQRWRETAWRDAELEADKDRQLGYVLHALKPIAFEEIGDEPRFELAEPLRTHEIVSGISVLIEGGDAPFGVLGVYASERRTFSEFDIHFVRSIADLLAQALEQHRTREALEESEARYRSLFEDSRDAVYVTSADGEVIDMNPAGLEMFGYRRDELIGSNARRLYADPDERQRFETDIAENDSIKDFEVELQKSDGTTIDCLLTSSARRDASGEVVRYQGIIRDITERKQLKEQLEKRALHDWLTGLPNRALLRERLEGALARAERHGEAFLLVFIDLDNFKTINDSFGHEAGDRVLEEVGGRLESIFRCEDTIARVGGDEFLVLLEHVDDQVDDLEVIRDRLQQVFGPPFHVKGRTLDLDASIGISRRIGGDDEALPSLEVDELIRAADRSMYRAKRQEGTTYRHFEPSRDARDDFLQPDHHLRASLEGDDLLSHYHPVVELGSNAIRGLELLVRCRHPTRGELSHAECLSLARQKGVLGRLNEKLFRRVRDHWAELQSLSEASPDFLLMGLEPPQLQQEALRNQLDLLVEGESPLSTDQIALELTESQVMGRPDRIGELHDAGYRIVVDDFGTGYSSLGYLKDLDIDGLKIAGSFVQGLERDTSNAAIIDVAATLGKRLDLHVVAEGVETSEQLDVVRERGCDCAQGDYFASPMPIEELKSLLERTLHSDEKTAE